MVGTLLDAELPGDLAGARLLELVHPDAGEAIASARAAGESYDLLACRDVLRSSPFPMALLTDLWRLAAPGAVLLLESEVLAEPEHSAYARFAPATSGGAGWLPGRLALRWMVETAGFDVERWLGEPDAGSGSRVGLRATRSEREPARSAP